MLVAAATNKNHGAVSNAVKLDQETEELKHAKLDLEVGKIIQQARNAKGRKVMILLPNLSKTKKNSTIFYSD